MLKYFYTLIILSLFSWTGVEQIQGIYQQKLTDNTPTLLDTQSLPLAFQEGSFYTWNQNDTANMITGIFTTKTQQSYLLNKDGTYNNLNLQVSNFTRFDDDLGIVTLKNFHKNNNTNFINKSFLLNKNNLSNITLPIATVNSNFINWTHTTIISTGIGADLITNTGMVTNLVLPYHFGNGLTTFTPINDNYGIFVGGDQKCYVLKHDGTITNINITGTTTPLMAPNPILLNCFVTINDNGGIIRNIEGQLFYLTIDSAGDTTTTPLTNTTTPLISNNINFFTKTNNNQGILNISLKNSSNLYGQPYLLDTNNIAKIKLTKINNHFMNNFTLLHNNLGIFTDNNLTTFFVDNNLKFTEIGTASNFQRINDDLGIIDKINGKSLLSDSANAKWTRINTISFTSTNKSLTNFVNINQGTVKRTNNWVSNQPLTLSVTNSDLDSITGAQVTPLKPDANGNITTTIVNTSTIKINFKDGQTIIYDVLIYVQDTLPTLDNSTNTNYQYVGIVNDKLYDINSTNTIDGFTINFNYDTTIQYVNIISIDKTTMNKEYLWTIKPNTTFTLVPQQEDIVYLLQTVNWNNISSWQYFTVYKNKLPIVDFWTTNKGKTLWNSALKLGYSINNLKTMKAKQVEELINKSVNWKLAQTRGAIFGYIISGFLSIGVIIAIISIIYDWYLKQYSKKN